MSPRFILGRENVPCVADVVNRSLKADCTDSTDYTIVSLTALTLSGRGRGGSAPKVSSITRKRHEILKNKLSDFDCTPSTVILHISSITIPIRFCHGNLLFTVCHIIFGIEKTKKLELFSR